MLADYRDNYGRLSRAGIAVLSGMILSAIVGVVTTSIESYKSGQANKEQAARTEALLRELSRAVLPIKHVSITYWVEIPPTIDSVARYIKRLEQGILERRELLGAFPPSDDAKVKGLDGWARGVDGSVVSVKITKDSDLWPTAEEIPYPLAHNWFPVSVNFFRKPVVVRDYIPMHGASDLGMWAVNAERLELNWDIKRRRLEIIGDTQFDKSLWKSNGRVASIVDLQGGQILLSLPGSNSATRTRAYAAHITPSPTSDAFERALVLRTAVFNFGDGHSYWLNGRKFERSSTAWGSSVLAVRLPASEVDFAAFTKSSREDDE